MRVEKARLSFCWNLSGHAVANVIPLTRPTEIFELSKKTAVHADQFVLFDRFFFLGGEDHGDSSRVLEASSQ